MSSPDPNSRLMIVSNRLPVGIKCLADDQYDFSPSCGGLVTGLKGLAHNDMAFLWYGWPGTTICPERVPHLKGTLRNKFNAVPVHLDQETAELYYNGFSSTSRDQRFVILHLVTDNSPRRLDHLAPLPLPTRQSLLSHRSFRRLQESQRDFRRYHGVGP